MEQEITLVVKTTAKKGSEDAVKKELLTLVEPTRKEKGCIQYNLHVETNTGVFVFYEIWENNDVLQLHTRTDHFKNTMGNVKDLLEKPMDVMVLNRI
jgi:quinol monooxygenase YgiN